MYDIDSITAYENGKYNQGYFAKRSNTKMNITTLRTALETAYINGATASSLAYRPQFVSNNHKEGKKVLSSVEDELLACDQCGIHHNEWNYATFADVKRTGKEEYSGRDSDNELSEFQ